MKTVKIRACVAVGPDGRYVVAGHSYPGWDDRQAAGERFDMDFEIGCPRVYHWIEAEVPAYPEPETVKAEVVA